jgi:hypothetical protein
MKEIYQGCEEVLIWMGHCPTQSSSEASMSSSTDVTPELRSWSGDDSDKSMLDLYWNDFNREGEKFHLKASRNIDHLFHAFCFIRLQAAGEHFHKLPPFVDLGGTINDTYREKVIQVLSSFIGSSWFTRIWVVQEAILPPKATCLYGPMTFPLDLIMDAADKFTIHTSSCCIKEYSAHARTGTMSGVPQFFNKIHEIGDRKKEWRAGWQTNLLPMCLTYRRRLAKEDKDKVYGLLGLATHWEPCGPLVPDYSLSVSQVYQQVVLSAIKHGGGNLTPFNLNIEKRDHLELVRQFG